MPQFLYDWLQDWTRRLTGDIINENQEILMVTHFNKQLSDALVRFQIPVDMVHIQAQLAAKYMALILLLLGYCLCETVIWRWCISRACQYTMEVIMIC